MQLMIREDEKGVRAERRREGDRKCEGEKRGWKERESERERDRERDKRGFLEARVRAPIVCTWAWAMKLCSGIFLELRA